MSAVVDAIRAELAEWREELAVRSEARGGLREELRAARDRFGRAQERLDEADKRIDTLVSALHLLGERDVEGSVEVRDDE